MADMSRISISSIPMDLFMKYFNENNLKENINYVMERDKNLGYTIKSMTLGIDSPSFSKPEKDIDDNLTANDVADITEKIVPVTTLPKDILIDNVYKDSQDFLYSLGMDLLEYNSLGYKVYIKNIEYTREKNATDTNSTNLYDTYYMYNDVLSDKTTYPFYISYQKIYEIVNGENKTENKVSANYHKVRLFNDTKEILSFDDLPDNGDIKIRIYDKFTVDISNVENIRTSCEKNNILDGYIDISGGQSENDYVEYTISVDKIHKFNFDSTNSTTVYANNNHRFISNVDLASTNIPGTNDLVIDNTHTSYSGFIKARGYIPTNVFTITEHKPKESRKKNKLGQFLVRDSLGNEIPLTDYKNKIEKFTNAVRSGFYALHGDRKPEEKVNPYVVGGLLDGDDKTDSARLYWYAPNVEQASLKLLGDDEPILVVDISTNNICGVYDETGVVNLYEDDKTDPKALMRPKLHNYYKYVIAQKIENVTTGDTDGDGENNNITIKTWEIISGNTTKTISGTEGSNAGFTSKTFSEPKILYISDVIPNVDENTEPTYSFEEVQVVYEKLSNELFDNLITGAEDKFTTISDTTAISDPIIYNLTNDYSYDIDDVSLLFTDDALTATTTDDITAEEIDDKKVYISNTDITNIQNSDKKFIRCNIVKPVITHIGGIDVSGYDIKLDPIKNIMYFDEGDEGFFNVDLRCAFENDEYGDIKFNHGVNRSGNIVSSRSSFKYDYMRLYPEKNGDKTNYYVKIPLLYHNYNVSSDTDEVTTNMSGTGKLEVHIKDADGNIQTKYDDDRNLAESKERKDKEAKNWSFYTAGDNINFPIRFSIGNKKKKPNGGKTFSLGLYNANSTDKKAYVFDGDGTNIDYSNPLVPIHGNGSDIKASIQDDSKCEFKEENINISPLDSHYTKNKNMYIDEDNDDKYEVLNLDPKSHVKLNYVSGKNYYNSPKNIYNTFIPDDKNIHGNAIKPRLLTDAAAADPVNSLIRIEYGLDEHIAKKDGTYELLNLSTAYMHTEGDNENKLKLIQGDDVYGDNLYGIHRAIVHYDGNIREDIDPIKLKKYYFNVNGDPDVQGLVSNVIDKKHEGDPNADQLQNGDVTTTSNNNVSGFIREVVLTGYSGKEDREREYEEVFNDKGELKEYKLINGNDITKRQNYKWSTTYLRINTSNNAIKINIDKTDNDAILTGMLYHGLGKKIEMYNEDGELYNPRKRSENVFIVNETFVCTFDDPYLMNIPFDFQTLMNNPKATNITENTPLKRNTEVVNTIKEYSYEMNYHIGYFKLKVDIENLSLDYQKDDKPTTQKIECSRRFIEDGKPVYNVIKTAANETKTVSNILINKVIEAQDVLKNDSGNEYYHYVDEDTDTDNYKTTFIKNCSPGESVDIQQQILNLYKNIFTQRANSERNSTAYDNITATDLYWGAKEFYRKTPIILLDPMCTFEDGQTSVKNLPDRSKEFSKVDRCVLDAFKYNVYKPYLEENIKAIGKEHIITGKNIPSEEVREEQYKAVTQAKAVIATQDTEYDNPSIFIKEIIDMPTNKLNSADDAVDASDSALKTMVDRERYLTKSATDTESPFSSEYLESFEELNARNIQRGYLNSCKYISAVGGYVGTPFYDTCKDIGKDTFRSVMGNKHTVLSNDITYTDNTIVENYTRITGMGDLLTPVEERKERSYQKYTGEDNKIILSREKYSEDESNEDNISNVDYSPSSPYVRILDYEKFPLNEIRNKTMSKIYSFEDIVNFEGDKTRYSNFFNDVIKDRNLNYETRYESFGDDVAMILAGVYYNANKTKIINDYNTYIGRYFESNSTDSDLYNKNRYRDNEADIIAERLSDNITEKKVYSVTADNKKEVCNKVISLLKEKPVEDENGQLYKWVML